jgi:hypothetical protein
MVHWVYVLECIDDYLYIGETIRLFSRFDEHVRSRGGSNTLKHKPKKLIGLYKVNDNYSYWKYRNALRNGDPTKFILEGWDKDGDNLLIENRITERFLYERRENDAYGYGLEWYKVRGGKYTRDSMDETVAMYKWAGEKEGRFCHSKNPVDAIPVFDVVDRPLCKCGCPSEVKLSKDKKKIYFVCALKNVWNDFAYRYLQIGTPCDFWQLYNENEDKICLIE